MEIKTNSLQTNTTNFMEKYKSDLSEKVKMSIEKDIKVKILSIEQIQLASQELHKGKLVAFPTETVYGLGANALNEQALREIYRVKKRPLTDPIIVHVNSYQQAQSLIEISQKQNELFKILTDKYWPGPLTIVVKANLQVLPSIVTAQTGFVGIRSPRHFYAQKLIKESQLPIGAPSANLFSHVSPTSPIHVFNDFFNDQISIIDGDRCQFGLQSTVIKISQECQEIIILRQGSLQVNKLKQCLQKQFGNNHPKIIAKQKIVSNGVKLQSPGQFFKHYSPNLPCYILTQLKQDILKFKINDQIINLDLIALISFNKNVYNKCRSYCKYYFEVGQTYVNEELQKEEIDDIFCTKQQKFRMRQIYALLRKCQNLQIKVILIGWSGLKEGSLWDKVFRAAEGVQISNIN